MSQQNLEYAALTKILEFDHFYDAILFSLKITPEKIWLQSVMIQFWVWGLGVISLKLLGVKLAPKLVYFVLRKELLNLKWNDTLFAA